MSVPIPLALVGCDYLGASVRHRGCLVMGEADRRGLTGLLRTQEAGAGLLVLETCNRVEWIVESDEPLWMADLLAARMRDMWLRADLPARPPEPYRHLREAAVDHVLRTVAGLESLSAGEAQIAGQFQRALSRAVEERTAGPLTRNLGSVAGRVAKAASRLGYRSNARRGMHVVAARYLESWLSGAKPSVLVVGMGEIGRRTASTLEERRGCSVIRMNRTVDERHRGTWRPLRNLVAAARDVDAVVLATGADRPILDLARLDPRKVRRLVVLDLGVPAQAQGVSPVGVQHVTIDEMVRGIWDPASQPVTAAVESEIEREKARFRRYSVARRLVPVLDGIRRSQARALEVTLPQRIEIELRGLDAPVRSRVLAVTRGVLRQFSGGLVASIYESFEGRDRGRS